MYKLPSKLKLFSIIIMVVGLVGITYGFLTAPKTVEDVKEIMASHQEQGEGHAEAENENSHEESGEMNFIDKARGQEGYTAEAMTHEQDVAMHENAHGDEHLEHSLHQMQSKPWAAALVPAFFFFMLALGALAFYAIQYAASAGWSPVLFRVIEGITTYVLPGSVIVFLIVMFAGTHFYPWQNHELVADDKILQGKSGYLNFPFFLIRSIIYVIGWNLYRFYSRRNSLREIEATDTNYYYKRNFRAAVFFLVFFISTEAMMAWDWFMSMTPHWFSTLFAWYVFATMFVSSITTIALVTIYLKRLGFLPFVNDSHLHDLGKFMFAFSIFWTYLWFGQFMLIWYANIPEEVTYFIIRIQEYNLLFWGMLVLNFVFPILILMNSDFKRTPWFVILAGVAILVGHYTDVYLLVMPSVVGAHWSIGISEIAGFLFFLGLFIFVVGTGLGKVNLRPEGNPFIKESENYHY